MTITERQLTLFRHKPKDKIREVRDTREWDLDRPYGQTRITTASVYPPDSITLTNSHTTPDGRTVIDNKTVYEREKINGLIIGRTKYGWQEEPLAQQTPIPGRLTRLRKSVATLLTQVSPNRS